jgi:hypothetical protein
VFICEKRGEPVELRSVGVALSTMRENLVGDNGAAPNKFQAAAAVVALLAGLVLAGACVFSWSGVAYSSTGDRRICFVAGLLSVAVAVIILTTRRFVLGWNIVPGFFAVQLSNGAAVEIRDHSFEYAAYPLAEVQPALQVAVASAGVILATGAVGLVVFIVRAARRRMSTGATRSGP